METKKYYWLKLKEDFFKDKEIKKLRRIAGGDTYTIIYLKLMLLGMRDECKLYFEGIEDTFAEELALDLDEDTENVKVTLLYLLKMGLLQEVNENELFLTRLPECIGKETPKAEIMRKKRARDKEEKLTSGNNVTEVLPPVTFCYTEKEKEKEKELDIEKEKRKEALRAIISYLNEKAGTKFKPTSKDTQKHINARLEEGYTAENFKAVIDKKVEEWQGTEMAQYLRPATLFGTKFEAYLNAPAVKRRNYNDAAPIVQVINGREYECRNGRFYIPNGNGVEVNPYADDDLPF